MTKKSISTNEIEQRLSQQRDELTSRLTSLQQAHGNAALQAAEGETNALKDVSALKRQMQEVADELASLDAAQGALDDRKAEERRLRQIDELKNAAAQVPGLAGETLERWVALEKAMQAMGKAWKEFEESREQLSRTTWVCANAARHSADHVVMQPALNASTARDLAGMLLWEATRGEIPVTANGDSNPEVLRGRIERQLERVIGRSEEDAARGIEKLVA